MKKLLVLAFIALFAAGASAQGNANYYIGEVDGSDFNAGVDKWIDVPVFFNGDEDVWVADLCHPLGVEVATIDQFDIPGCNWNFWPFNSGQFGWSTKDFVNYNDDVVDPGESFANIAGWHSVSFVGFARTVFTDPDWLHWTGAPIQILSFKVHTVDDDGFIGTTRCALGPGADPLQGAPNAGDTLGGPGYPVVLQYSCLYFSPNQNCEIVEPLDELIDCTYEDFTYCFDVYDPDSDEPVVTASVGTPVLVGTTPDELPDEGTTYHYCIDFDMEAFCGTCFNGDLIITAVDMANFPDEPQVANAGPLTIIGAITASMDPAVYIWPGMEEWMPVYLDVCGACFCLGGFVFTIEYDASVLDITDVVRGAALMGGEYWNVNYNVDGPGTIRVTFINDLNNQTPVEEICGLIQGPLFEMKFLLSAEYEYLSNFCTPICFMFDGEGENHYDYNNVSDEGGYHVWMNDGCDDAPDSTQFGTLQLNLECGNIKVLNEHNVVLGDLNLNGFAFDVGDAVLLANHMIDPANYPFTLRQMFASDVNGDGLQATIADLIYMINMINNVGGGKVAPLDVIASVAMPVDTYGNVDVTITSELSVGGALVSINHTGVELGVPTADGMNCDYSDNGDVMNVLVYNMDAVSFAPGTNVLFTIPVLSEGAISFGDVSVSDNRGALLDARTAYDAPIPTEFSVSQNFPNPFNARTSLSFGLPTSALTTVNIYNVAGQLVESMNLGELTAGHHSVVWDASNVASGIYFYKISAGNSNETMKMTLLK